MKASEWMRVATGKDEGSERERGPSSFEYSPADIRFVHGGDSTSIGESISTEQSDGSPPTGECPHEADHEHRVRASVDLAYRVRASVDLAFIREQLVNLDYDVGITTCGPCLEALRRSEWVDIDEVLTP